MEDNSSELTDLIDLLPDNERRITQIEHELSKIDQKINKHILEETLTNKMCEKHKEKLFKLLFLVGDLSIPISEKKEAIEKEYIKRYRKNPKLGKRLFIDHYYGLHKPYDRIKTNIWKTINKVLPEDEQV